MCINNNTDKEHLENLMAMAEQAREAQKTYFKNRGSVARSHVNTLLNDAKMKEDSLDSLLKHLRSLGYRSNKIISKAPEQGSIF